jgi:hypothetical protein
MPDPTLSAAIKEAYASAPSSVVVYHTLEIYNPAFSVPIRVVRDEVSLDARREATAPRDASAIVTFAAYAFDLVPPDQSTQSVPTCAIEIDNVDRLILSQIDVAATSGNVTTVIYRQYLSGNLTIGPENLPPVILQAQSISATPQRIKMVAGFADLVNKRFPAQDYDPEVFIGLAS